MMHYLRRAVRKNARRASRLAAPLMLAAGLFMFSLSQIAPATTLWSETLTIGSSVTTGAFACKPLAVTGATVTTTGSGPTGSTTFTYKLNGGGDKNGSPECANKDLSFFALPVCFKPDDTVTAHTQPANWTYDPKNKPGEYQVKWNSNGSVGAGPFSNVTFSFTVAGTGVPTEQVHAIVHAGNGQDMIDAGLVTVPKPAACVSGAPLSANDGPSSVFGGVDGDADAGEAGTTPTPGPSVTGGGSAGNGGVASQPTKTPTTKPTATPTPRLTPTPRTGPGGAFEVPTPVK
ncbi:MAG: hypothetical protein IT302_03030 [Dehalococcoidia bacterium]|nr:hypothetical protein [Dehalococcoidia bacterium]